MSTFRSGYSVTTAIVLPVAGMRQRFECGPGDEVTVPDAFDRLVAKECPGWSKAESKAPEAPKPEAPKAQPQQPQQHQKGGK